jgi:hypothetical protein
MVYYAKKDGFDSLVSSDKFLVCIFLEEFTLSSCYQFYVKLDSFSNMFPYFY